MARMHVPGAGSPGGGARVGSLSGGMGAPPSATDATSSYDLTPIPRNILSNGVGLAVNGLISFLLTPVLIHRLGTFDYAMWTLSASVVDYLGLLDLGMRVTLFRFISRMRGGNDRLSLNQTFASALCITLVMSCAVSVLTLLLMALLPDFFAMDGPQRDTFQRLLLLLGLSAAATFPAYMLGTYLCAAGRFDLYNLAGIVTGIVRAALIVTGLAMGYRLVGIAAVTLAVAMLSVLLHWGMLRRADPGLTLEAGLIRWPRIQELARFNFYASLTALGDFMRFYTDSVVIGRVIGVAAITQFSVAARLLYFFRQILVAVSSPIMGRIGELDGRGDDHELKRFFLRATNFTSLVSVFLGALLVLNGRDLIRLWVGDSFSPAYSLVLVLTMGYVVAFAQQPSLDAVMVRGRHRVRGWLSLGEGIANILLSLFLARRYGLIGVAMGTAIPMLVIHLLIQPWYTLRVVGLSASAYVREGLARPAIAGVIFFAVVTLINQSHQTSGPADFAWTILWETATFAVLAYVLVLTGPDRQRLFAGSRFVAASVMRAVGGRPVR